ncbi:MAG: translation initiation factor [Terrimicrobiaceae bacterium]
MSKKIPVSAPQQPLQSPFSTLSSAGFPEVPAHSAPSRAKKKFRVALRRERAQRGGKTVIVVSQLPTHLSVFEIEGLASGARRELACGGAVRGREIEIQGDQAGRVRHYFEALGYEVVGP